VVFGVVVWTGGVNNIFIIQFSVLFFMLARQSKQKKNMRAFLQKEGGFTSEQMDYIGSAQSIKDTQREHRRVDKIVRAAVRKSVHTFTDIFKTATHKPKFLQGGKYGITALTHLPSVPVPVVIKFTEKPRVAQCEKRLGSNVCLMVDDLQRKSYEWTGMTDPVRERKMYAAFSDVAHDGASPHFLHAYLGAPVDLTKKATVQDVAAWLGADKTKVGSYGNTAIKSLQINVLQYGGPTMYKVLQAYVPKATAKAVAIVRSAITQVLQATTAMVTTMNMHHNDLHTENILGTYTSMTHLYYWVQSTNKKAGTARSVQEAFDRVRLGKTKAPAASSRYFRVPTFGVLWRVIDFGLATSGTLFTPLDHGIMARVCWGGPMWREAAHGDLRNIPLELYDVARFLSDLTHSVGALPRESKNKVRTDIAWVTSRALHYGKQEEFALPISEVGERISLVEPKDIRTPAHLHKVKEEIRKLANFASDHGIMAKLFMDTAAKFGFEISQTEAKKHMSDTNTYVLHIET
jgi:hypothetical protein